MYINALIEITYENTRISESFVQHTSQKTHLNSYNECIAMHAVVEKVQNVIFIVLLGPWSRVSLVSWHNISLLILYHCCHILKLTFAFCLASHLYVFAPSLMQTAQALMRVDLREIWCTTREIYVRSRAQHLFAAMSTCTLSCTSRAQPATLIQDPWTRNPSSHSQTHQKGA